MEKQSSLSNAANMMICGVDGGNRSDESWVAGGFANWRECGRCGVDVSVTESSVSDEDTLTSNSDFVDVSSLKRQYACGALERREFIVELTSNLGDVEIWISDIMSTDLGVDSGQVLLSLGLRAVTECGMCSVISFSPSVYIVSESSSVLIVGESWPRSSRREYTRIVTRYLDLIITTNGSDVQYGEGGFILEFRESYGFIPRRTEWDTPVG
ncbi:hypothetical protein Tco_0246084 [Tanacetum coccineum]